MKLISQNNLNNINFVKLHGSEFLEKFRYAGKVVSETLTLLKQIISENKPITTLELDKIAEDFILKNKCTPTFKNYGSGKHNNPFPNATCISVNKMLVHGIPSDYLLQDGDKISFDLGATFDGAIADSAVTVTYGNENSQQTKLINACRESLYKGIKAVGINNKIGAIGEAVYKSAKGNGFNVITQYGGHSISLNKPHSDPFISNKSSKDEGVRMQPGLILAIEPQLTFGSTNTYIGDDGWSVYSQDIGSHFEHSVYLHEDNTVEILTKREDEII